MIPSVVLSFPPKYLEVGVQVWCQCNYRNNLILCKSKRSLLQPWVICSPHCLQPPRVFQSLPRSHGNIRKLELLNQTIRETGTMSQSSTPKARRLQNSLCYMSKDAKPLRDWPPGKGRGRGRGRGEHRSAAVEPSVTSTSCAVSMTRHRGHGLCWPRTEEKNKPSFALLVKWTVLMNWLMTLTSSVLRAYMFKGQELHINKLFT